MGPTGRCWWASPSDVRSASTASVSIHGGLSSSATRHTTSRVRTTTGRSPWAWPQVVNPISYAPRRPGFDEANSGRQRFDALPRHAEIQVAGSLLGGKLCRIDVGDPQRLFLSAGLIEGDSRTRQRAQAGLSFSEA